MQIKKAVLNGELASGEILPSIRSLAKQCSCSVITVRKGYEKLENEGLIYTKAGKGCFVKDLGDEKINASRREQLNRVIDDLIEVSDDLGFERSQLSILVEERVQYGK